MQNDSRFNGYNSYIMRAYVNFLEGAGAQIVPLLHGESTEVLDDKLAQVNGVMFPGGDGDYFSTAQYIQQRVKEINNNGTFLPLWGTCLGHETILQIENSTILSKVEMHHISTFLDFQVAGDKTKMFNGFSEDDLYLLSTRNMTYNSHTWGILAEHMRESVVLNKMFKITSTSTNEYDQTFVASFEGNTLPLFGTQFHPEKTIGIFNDHLHIDHSWDSIRVQRKFADSFVKMARTNNHTFGDHLQLQPHLIENHHLIPTQTPWADCYVFK